MLAPEYERNVIGSLPRAHQDGQVVGSRLGVDRDLHATDEVADPHPVGTNSQRSGPDLGLLDDDDCTFTTAKSPLALSRVHVVPEPR